MMNGSNSLKEKIINVVLIEEGLTAKQVHFRLQRLFGLNSSYQATHKTMKQLVEEKTLSKNGKEYLLSRDYFKRIQENADKIAEKFKGKELGAQLGLMKEGETQSFSLDGILETGWFLIDKIFDLPNPANKPCLALWRFCYSIVGLEKKHLEGLEKAFEKNKWVLIVEEKNEMDKMFGETLKQYGAKKIVYGVNCTTPLSDKVIIGDHVCEIVYPAWFRKLWSIQNKLPKKVMDFDLARHIGIMRSPKPKIKAIVTKNREMAEEYREEYKKYF
jgi:hypothetical protein